MKPGTVVIVKRWWLFKDNYELGVVTFYDPVREVARVKVLKYCVVFREDYIHKADVVVPIHRLEVVKAGNGTALENFWADVRSGLHDFAFTHKQSDKTPVT